jgi:hypothetical protein
MIDWNALLANHPDIAKYLLLLFAISEGLSLVPETITKATGVIQLLYITVLKITAKFKKPPPNDTGTI